MKRLRVGLPFLTAAIAISMFGLARSGHTQVKTLPSDPEAIKQRIVELERQWQQAVAHQDRSALDALLAKDFSEEELIKILVEPGHGQVHTIKRDAYLAKMLKSPFQSYSISADISVEIKDPATAIARLKLAVEPAPRLIPLSSGESRQGGYDVVDKWVKTGSGWQVSLRYASLVVAAMIVPLNNQD